MASMPADSTTKDGGAIKTIAMSQKTGDAKSTIDPQPRNNTRPVQHSWWRQSEGSMATDLLDCFEPTNAKDTILISVMPGRSAQRQLQNFVYSKPPRSGPGNRPWAT